MVNGTNKRKFDFDIPYDDIPDEKNQTANIDVFLYMDNDDADDADDADDEEPVVKEHEPNEAYRMGNFDYQENKQDIFEYDGEPIFRDHEFGSDAAHEENSESVDGRSKTRRVLLNGCVTIILSVICVVMSILSIVALESGGDGLWSSLFFHISICAGIVLVIISIMGISQSLKKGDILDSLKSKGFWSGYVSVLILGSNFSLIAVLIAFFIWDFFTCYLL